MPLYRFSLDVPAPVYVVAERIRAIIRPAPGFWEAWVSSWQHKYSGLSFVGEVADNSFRLRRNIGYRNSFLPRIRGRMISTATGTRVDVLMFMHPLVFIFMLFWLVGVGYAGLRTLALQSAAFPLPLMMTLVGLSLGLGGFYWEAKKARALLTSAVFNAAVDASQEPQIISPPAPATSLQPKTSRTGFVSLIFAVAFLLFAAIAFIQYRSHLRACPAFQDSLALLSGSREAQAELGTPIRVGGFVRGVVRQSAQSAYALLSIPVRGPRGKGMLYVVGNRLRNRWDLERVALWTKPESHRLDLTPSTRPEPFHYPATGAVYLIPLDSAAAASLQNLPAYYAARLSLNVIVLPVLPLGPETVNAAAKQVIAETAVDFITRANRKLAEDLDSVFLAVTSQDLNIRSAGWRFATNYRSGRFAIISTARLRGTPWFDGSNPEVFPVRVRKMVTKNVALLRYPVSLSADPTSALASSVFTARDVDQMGEEFLGERGTWSASPVLAPCFSITQGPQRTQAWRSDCTRYPPNDSRFETFENYTDITLLVMAHTDFPFDRQRYLSFIRKYRNQDDRSRSFGIGGNDSFDIFPVGDSQTFSTIELILEDGGRIHFDRVSGGTGVADADLRAGVLMSSPFSHSRLEWNGNGWNLKTVAGWTYQFPASGPDRSPEQSALVRIETGEGAVSIQRNSAGALQHIKGLDGSIDFTCDSNNRIIRAQNSSGHTIRYEYGAGGKLKRVQDSELSGEFYQYDPANRLTSVLDSTGRPLLVNTYGYLGEVTSQTLADHRTLRYAYGFDENQRTSSVTFTDDHGYVTRWIRGRDGFYGSLPQPPKQ